MKKKAFIYFVLIITIINLSSLGVILYQRQKISALPYKMKGQNVFERIQREVKLTSGQMEQFQKLRIAFHAQLDSLSANVAKKNKLLAAEIKKENPDTVVIDQLVKDISAIQMESKYLVIQHFFLIKKILTKEQQEIFFNIVLKRFLGKNKLSGPGCISRKGE